MDLSREIVDNEMKPILNVFLNKKSNYKYRFMTTHVDGMLKLWDLTIDENNLSSSIDFRCALKPPFKDKIISMDIIKDQNMIATGDCRGNLIFWKINNKVT